MKVFKYVLAVLFFLTSLEALISASFLSSLFALILGLCFLPPISEKLKNRFDLWGKKGIRYIIYIVLFILVGAFSKESKSIRKVEAKNNQEVVTKNNNSIKDSLNAILKGYNLTVCNICSAVSKIEVKVIKDADIKFPNYGKHHNEYSERLRIKETNSYIKDKGISEDLLNSATVFAYECSETERKDRVEELKYKKRIKLAKKEKIEDCFGNACNLIQMEVKRSMHNSKSFVYVDCRYLGAENNSFTISYSFKGQNPLGAIVLEKVKAKISIEGCKVLTIEQE